ncbi:MAG: chloride channel protein [Bacteroidales bacterium]
MKYLRYLSKFLIWREKYIGHRQFVLLLSFVIGLLSGLAAVLLKNTVHLTHDFLINRLHIDKVNLLYFALPFLGILLTVLFVKFIVKDNISHGISRILYAISKRKGQLRTHNSYSSIIASTLTVGFGGSVGLEAPIVLTGSSIGSNISRLLRMNYKTTTLLIGCGAAGAIAGIFKAPIAAIVFALEVLMLDLTMVSIIPLLISSVTGATVAYFLLGKGVVFSFTLQDPFLLSNLPYYLILGIFCGLLSVYFTKGTMFVEKKLGNIANPYYKIVLGGIGLGLLIFFLPPLFGEGYDTLRTILGGDAREMAHGSLFYGLRNEFGWFMSFLLLILVFKVIAMALTTGSGGVGGIFAPTLFMGGIAGYMVARIINTLQFIDVSERNFALVGMAGLMAGVMHAPLTAIFLIAEITNGYGLFIPLIVTSTIAYLTIMYFEPHSIYHSRLAKRGELITHHKDKAVLTLLKLEKVIEKDFKKISPDATLGDLVHVISKSKRNIFPVIEEDGKLAGIVLLDNIRDIMFNTEMYDETKVENIMIMPPAYVRADEVMESVMNKFEETGAWNLPVIDQEGKYLGFISKSKIFNVYRDILVQFTDE